jgi:hypothetical protein
MFEMFFQETGLLCGKYKTAARALSYMIFSTSVVVVNSILSANTYFWNEIVPKSSRFMSMETRCGLVISLEEALPLEALL